MLKKLLSLSLIFLVGSSVLLNTGCRKKQTQKTSEKEKIELVYYRLFDNEEIFAPLIQEFERQNPHMKIKYRKFTNPEVYFDLILNELAEGEGPDMFSVNNTWLARNYRKVSAMPSSLLTPETFKETFVKVTHADLLKYDDQSTEKIYALPLHVDTLALYYNKEHLENQIPSRGKPSATWEELKEDVFKLTKKDNSFERFETTGLAAGRSDNILRGIDILYLLFLQYKTAFYNQGYTQATFASKQGITGLGKNAAPGIQAIDLYTSFALPSNKNYSWNNVLADSQSPDKEIRTFARGKTSMIFGYSYLYNDIINTIRDLEKNDLESIKEDDVKIAPAPQIFDPEKTNDLDAFASYFAETVSRTSKHPNESWEFLKFLVSKENMQYYNEKTHRPASRRDLLEEQQLDPIYGVFAEQAGYAESLIVYDEEKYKEIFEKAITAVIETKKPEDALKEAQDQINQILPEAGLIKFPQEETAEQ